MICFSFRSWLNRVAGAPRIRNRRWAGKMVERLESRVVLSAYSVTSTVDSIDVNPGDGIAADADGNATLRAAVIDANALAGTDTITLGAGVFALSLAGQGENASAAGDLDITGDLVIEGAGADQTFLDAALLDRFFHVQPGGSLTLRNVTIRNGLAADGGAIENDGTLVLENVELTGNAATIRGGAIFNNSGDVTLQSVKVYDNESRNANPTGSNSFGGGLISIGGNVTIQGSEFSNNSAATFGGAIYSSATTLNVTDTAFSENSAMTGGAVRLVNGSTNFTNSTFNGDHGLVSGGAIASSYCTLTITGGSFTGSYLEQLSPSSESRSGGAIYLLGAASSVTTVTITGVTFEQTGGGDGGAIYNQYSRLVLRNSTFSGVTGERGGAIWNTAGGQAVLSNITIVGSSGTDGGAILNNGSMQMTNSTISGNASGGVTLHSAAVASYGASASFQSANNLIAGNVRGTATGGGDFLVFRGATAPLDDGAGYDVTGTFFGPGGNLVGQRGNSTGFNEPTDHVGTAAAPIDPLLLPLADNGGPVKTMALSLQSPARDTGVAFGPATDARGMPRSGNAFDAGAYEFQNHTPVPINYSTTINYGQVLTGQLLATDADGDTLTFVLQQPVSSGTLVLQPNGQFTYTPPVEELGAAYFYYVVSDGHSVSSQRVAQIIVRPYNDPPVVEDQTFHIAENPAVPYNIFIGQIYAYDVDSSGMTAEIVSGNASGFFGINPQSRVVYLVSGSQLNFETTPTYNLVVRLTDNGSPAASTLVTITIEVDDVNEAPHAVDSTLAINENSPVGTVVGTVSFSDEDVGQPHTFEILGTDSPGVFAIDPSTGVITVADPRQLDFESVPQRSLFVRIADTGSPALAAYAVVTININDANDAPRVFGPPSLQINENSPSGTYVGQLFASDIDPGQSLTFAIASGNTDGAFSINPADGSIFIANSAAVNFEANSSFNLAISVTDNGSPNLSTTKTITIFVNDLNERPQASPASYSLNENSPAGTVVGTVTATDPDVGQQLTYSFSSGNINDAFAIDPATGQITVANPAAINFETTQSFNLGVAVFDNGVPPRAVNTFVTVSVVNVNEAPQITGGPFSLNENSAAGTVAGELIGFDPDFHRSLTFSIDSGNTNGAFAIDPISGIITVANPAALNFEATPVFNLVVKATENGPDPLSSTAGITISLSDVNETPQIAGGSFTLVENSADGTVVGNVVGSDIDAGQTLTYAIVSGNTNGAFTIDPATGQISVATSAALNYETTRSFNLTVSVTDNGTPAASASTSVAITLTNANDAPRFLDRSFTLAENSANGVSVGTVTGTDDDPGQTLTYSIVSGNTNGAFSINPTTGLIKVANSAALNLEATPTFSLIVRATDNGASPASSNAVVTIALSNVNEAPKPVAQSFSVAENSANGTVVGNFAASDPDVGQPLTYVIVSGNTNNVFAINAATGQISVANSASLNFESKSSYSLVIRVTDNGSPALTATATATISVQNQNEAPVVAAKSFSLNENAANGASVGTVTSTDPDAGQTRTYAIVAGNTDGAFVINATTGKITVANSSALNYETTPTFNLTVSVTDNGSPALTSTAAVTITLNNVNEAPLIAPQSFSLAENSANGTAVGVVAATDPDAGQTLSYSITSGNTNSAFAINSSTGRLTVANSAALDFETRPTFTLQVRATDNGSPSRSTTAAVTISLTDVLETLTINLDIVPGASPNTVRVGRTFEVAVLSTSTFDARNVNVSTVRFGKLGTEDSLTHNNQGQVSYTYRDVNNDGRLDLVVEVSTNMAGFRVGDTVGRLTGTLNNGQPIIGSSSVVVRN